MQQQTPGGSSASDVFNVGSLPSNGASGASLNNNNNAGSNNSNSGGAWAAQAPAPAQGGSSSSSGASSRVLTKPAVGVKNDGYDNEHSDLIMSVDDVLVGSGGRQYVVTELLGQGTFGQVRL